MCVCVCLRAHVVELCVKEGEGSYLIYQTQEYIIWYEQVVRTKVADYGLEQMRTLVN